MKTTPLFMDEEALENGFVCDWFVIGGQFSGLLAKYRKPATLSQVPRDFLRDLGYTVRLLGTFLDDRTAVPTRGVALLATQGGVTARTCFDR